MFIQLKDQVVNKDTIVKVDKPRKSAGVEWYIRTILDSTKTPENFISTFYNSEEEAKSEYERIAKQLCENKQ